MKTLLQIIGWASIAAGLVLFVTAIRADASNFVAAGWLISGIVSASAFLGMADIISRLKRIEASQSPRGIKRGAKAGYLPGWEPDDINSSGWNDPE